MQIPYATNEQPITLKIVIETVRPENIAIRIVDSQKIPGTNKPIAVYEDRFQKIRGKVTFFVKMPVSPKVALIQVYNTAVGNVIDGKDNSFRWTMAPKELERTIMPMNIPRRKAREFILFIEEFAKNKNIISAGFGSSPNSIYKSADGTFRVDYYDVLRDVRPYIYVQGQQFRNPNFGREVTTPMRTHADSGIFEISKKYTADYTVPETVVIGSHEFSHVNVNKDPANEKQADRNGATIALSMGYDKISTYNAFLKVFRNADTIQNREREKELYSFIQNFNVGDAFLIGA